MKTEQELAEFYERLKNELLETSLWPTRYLYKFIIPKDEDKLAQLEDVFKIPHALHQAINTQEFR